MPRTGVIAFALVAGFVVYVTAKGRLAKYMALVFTAPKFNVSVAAPPMITPDNIINPKSYPVTPGPGPAIPGQGEFRSPGDLLRQFREWIR